MNKKLKISLVLTVILCSFIFNQDSIHANNKDFIRTSGALDISLDETSLSVQYGTNVEQNRPTTFSGVFTDITDENREFTDDCYLETQLVADPDVYANDSIEVAGTQNQEHYPESSDITMNTGNLESMGNFSDVDNDYYTFNSTNWDKDGHYNGTYSFYGETGEVGTNISMIDGVVYSVDPMVSSSFEGHKEVMNLTNYGDGVKQRCYDYVSGETGSIEFWIATTDDTRFSAIAIGASGTSFGYSNLVTYVEIENDDFRIKAGNGVGGTQIIDFINNGMESNRWYHVKLEIDLENDNVTIYVDSVNYGTYNFIDDNEFSSFNCISFYMETDVVYSSYIDAVGYSWDSDYVVGDNWHYNSYNGTWNFENISTQEFSHEGTIDFNNITMAEGYYYGTYSFEGEVNETDLDISFVSAISSAEAIVNSEYGNHLEVINVSSSAFARTENYFSFQTSGTIEFWFNIQADVTTSFCLREGSSTRVYVGYSSSANDLYWYNSGSTEHGSAISLDTWYHLRIEFDTDTDLFSVYMNGNTEGVNKTFYSVSSTITRFMFEDSGNQVLCVDAIGYSWDSQYNEGYNINAYDLNPFLDNDFDILNNDYFMNVSIENDIHGHNNVLKLQENDNTNYLRIESQFGLKSSGVIECWVLTDSVQDWTTFLSIARYNSHRGYLYANSGNFYWHTITSGILDTGITITTNTWYHIRILFDSSTNDVDISINGDLVLESASYSGGQIDSIIFNTPSSGTNNLYIDVIGYSWDSNYDVGDNKYGADLGDSWWLFNSEDCNASIVGEDTSHKKTLKISDYSSSNSINATNYFSNQTSGTIEFWIKISNNTKTFEITMLSSSGQKSIYIILNSTTSQWAWYDGAYHDVLACENDVWYHFKINFDCSTDTYDWYINSILEVDDADFENSASSINCLKITTWSSQTDYTIYLDALSYSWDSDYDVGDNLYTDLCEYELQVDILLTEFSYTDYMCFMNITSYYKTDVDVSVDFLVHDNDNSVWLTINSSLNYADFYESHLGLNNETMQDIFDGDNEILLRFDASSVEKAFKLHIDCLNVSAFYKLLLSKDKTFTLLGLWKYRFHIPEDSFSSDWYYFNVIEHEDNFMAISESPYITKWILIGNDTEISTSIRFADDITGDSWSLYDGNDDPLSETFTKIVYCNGDTWVTTSNPNSQSWYTWSYSTTTWNAYATTYSFFSYPEVGYMYSYANTTWNVRGYEDHESSMFDIHSTFYFEESTITWNNKPALDDLLYNDQEIAVSAEWKSYDVGYIDENIYFAVTPEVLYTDVEFSTKESAYDSYLIHYPYKFKQYDGYFFVQGNSTETLKTKSSVFADVSLNAGDYFTIDCETDLENMDLQLLNEGTVVDTITLLYENTYEERQIIEVSVDNDVVFDQLQFVGSFDDTNYFICNDIRANGYDSSTQEQTTTFYIAPEESYSDYLKTGYYEMKIYDNDILRFQDTILITHNIEDCLQKYTPIYSIDCRLTLVNQDNEFLDISLFEVYATRILSNVTSRISLLDVNFRADLETIVIFEFYDRFSEHIKNETVDVETFIFVEIELFQLKIRNEATNYTEISIQRQGTSLNIEDIFSPAEMITYALVSDYYQITAINHENGEINMYNVSLVEDVVLVIESVYRSVYFAPFLADGTGLSWDSVRFYLNGSRRDFGFNVIQSDFVNITVLDYFNQTAYSSIVNLAGVNEYNIFIDLLSFKVINKASEMVNYTLIKNSIEESGNIFPNEIINYFLVNGTYSFTYTNQENMKSETLSVVLDSDRWVEINTTYFDVYFALFNFDGLGLNQDLVRFYINNARKDLGFNTLSQGINNLKVLDYFNSTLIDQNMDLSGYTEYNIIVEVYTLIINNNYTYSVRIEIERNGIEISQVIPAQSSLSYRFLPNIEYEIECYSLNGTLLSEQEITLDSNNKIVSFGFYSTEVPIDPVPLIANIYTLVWIVIFACVSVAIMAYFHYRMKGKVKNVPDNVFRKYSKKKSKNNGEYDNRIGFFSDVK